MTSGNKRLNRKVTKHKTYLNLRIIIEIISIIRVSNRIIINRNRNLIRRYRKVISNRNRN